MARDFGPIRATKNAAAVSPSDTVDLGYTTRGLYVGGAGNIVIIPEGQTTAVTLVGLVAGVLHPIACTRVKSTSTTATNIVAFYDET